MTDPNQQERVLQQSKHRRIRSRKLRVGCACTSLFVNTTDMINLYLSFMCARQKWSMMEKRIRIRGSGNYPWTVCQRNQINVLNKAPLQ